MYRNIVKQSLKRLFNWHLYRIPNWKVMEKFTNIKNFTDISTISTSKYESYTTNCRNFILQHTDVEDFATEISWLRANETRSLLHGRRGCQARWQRESGGDGRHFEGVYEALCVTRWKNDLSTPRGFTASPSSLPRLPPTVGFLAKFLIHRLYTSVRGQLHVKIVSRNLRNFPAIILLWRDILIYPVIYKIGKHCASFFLTFFFLSSTLLYAPRISIVSFVRANKPEKNY